MQPHKSYLVCATPRSGSTLLCEALTNTQRAGSPAEYFEALRATGLPARPQEYFEDGANSEIRHALGEYAQVDSRPAQHFENYADYLAEVREKGTTPNGVFGAKLMWDYFDDFMSNVRSIPQYGEMATTDILAEIFPALHYIYVTRNDKVRQAISLWKALQTQTWRVDEQNQQQHRAMPPVDARTHTGKWQNRVDHSHQTKHELVFSFAAIDYLVHRIIAHEAAWQEFFMCAGIEPLTVVYEDLECAYEETAVAILRYLHVPVPKRLTFAPRSMQRQADAQSEEWVQRYCMMKQEYATLIQHTQPVEA